MKKYVMTRTVTNILLVLIFATIIYFLTKQSARQVKVETELRDSVAQLNFAVDSLRDELFNESVANGRYELSLYHLQEVNPKAAKEFTTFLEHETE